MCSKKEFYELSQNERETVGFKWAKLKREKFCVFLRGANPDVLHNAKPQLLCAGNLHVLCATNLDVF